MKSKRLAQSKDPAILASQLPGQCGKDVLEALGTRKNLTGKQAGRLLGRNTTTWEKARIIFGHLTLQEALNVVHWMACEGRKQRMAQKEVRAEPRAGGRQKETFTENPPRDGAAPANPQPAAPARDVLEEMKAQLRRLSVIHAENQLVLERMQLDAVRIPKPPREPKSPRVKTAPAADEPAVEDPAVMAHMDHLGRLRESGMREEQLGLISIAIHIPPLLDAMLRLRFEHNTTPEGALDMAGAAAVAVALTSDDAHVTEALFILHSLNRRIEAAWTAALVQANLLQQAQITPESIHRLERRAGAWTLPTFDELLTKWEGTARAGLSGAFDMYRAICVICFRIGSADAAFDYESAYKIGDARSRIQSILSREGKELFSTCWDRMVEARIINRRDRHSVFLRNHMRYEEDIPGPLKEALKWALETHRTMVA